MKEERYVRAFGWSALTPFYDPVLRGLMRESVLKGALLAQARIEAGHRILDVGCGTGTLLLLAKESCPETLLAGLDPDPAILTIARRKALRAGVSVSLVRGDAVRLPHPDGAFDRVLTSFMLHHLTSEEKLRALGEARRVLRPGGELHVLDFGRPRGPLAVAASLLLRFAERPRDNLEGLLPDMLRRAGLAEVEEPRSFGTLFGTVTLVRGTRRAGAV
ncbi:MAG: methyltransferase domain-containing protein [Deltaproteobacteria bacterium]|nr:methyltransferase domain-containing protein [Deltaproteobacteria bacterium]